MASDRIKSVVGFAIAIVILGIILWFIGFDEVLTALRKANPWIALLTIPAAALWLTCWGLSLYVVLRALGAPIKPHKAVFVFTAAVFVNNATPFGQAGGEPISAMFISSASDSEYETGLAAIASVDTLHFIPSLSLMVVGLGYVGISAIQLTRDIVFAMLAVVVLAAIVPTIGYLGWRYRQRIKRFVVSKLAPIIRWIARVVPIVSAPDQGTIEHRIEGFFTAVGRVATDRRTILTAMSLSTIGWISLSASLWLSLYALGYVIPFISIVFVVPLGSVAGATPLPGGLGGLEAAFVALLVPLGVPASVAFSAVLIHRGATYWLPTLFGGGAAALLSVEAKTAD